MSKILSYNKKTTGEGWIPLSGQYGADEINMISDPNGGLSVKPRTAIPSPFAQMDLVKNAFRRLSANERLKGEVMDERLVSYALDIAQVFFNIKELKHNLGGQTGTSGVNGTQLHIVEWSKDKELELLQTTPSHRLLGDTLQMFLRQDNESFNFDHMDRLFFLVYGNEVIGCTSPVTLFMATPNAQPDTWNIPLEQNVNLFDKVRPLYERTDKFILCLYALFTAYPQLKDLCGEVNSYLITCFGLLPTNMKQTILATIGNPMVKDENSSEGARQYLQHEYAQIEEGVQALGVPFFCLRREDILENIARSDFRLMPSLPQPEAELIPLVLQNHLNAPTDNPYHYISDIWDDMITIRPEDYAESPSHRILPGTSHPYPWLTSADFFQPSLIKLDYALNGDCFFDGSLTQTSQNADHSGFLLPLTETYFKYFTVDDLQGTICGRRRFEMIHSVVGGQEQLKVILRLPVQKQGGYITLERTYVPAIGVDLHYNVGADVGYFITVPFALSIFPFIKPDHIGSYRVQVVDRALGLFENYQIGLQFFKTGAASQPMEVKSRRRSLKKEKRVGSDYYRPFSTFDYIAVQLFDERGTLATQGVVCPKWPNYMGGHDKFTFAIDFGTTNTHVECMRNGQMPEPLKLDALAAGRLVATLYNGEHLLYDVILKQEFLPKIIGTDYGFPLRTVLSEGERLDAENIDEIVALADANIPFIYEKESIGYGNRVVANLKWAVLPATAKRIKSFLTELALLMRAKVLLDGGDLSKVRLVWFYPLAMKVGNVHRMADVWSRIFRDIFDVDPDDRNLIQMPESVAPYYFYRCSSKFRGAASTVASIDIGGGSSDVVVFDSNASQPTILSSFRFAANVLFGDAFSDVPQGDSNPMTVKYVDYFRRLFDADDDRYGELNGILDDITSKRKSEDINAFLFSVIDNKNVGGNEVFSYDMRLAEDGRLKIAFIYFYSAIIYYVASMMKHRGLDMPRSVMFSGTGSKVLDIVGSQRDLDLISQAIFERVYGQQYGDNGFSVVMERKEPKQITCRGALMQVRDESGFAAVSQLNNMLDRFDSHLKYNYTGIDKEVLTYADIDDETTRGKLVDAVRQFNDFFIALCRDIHVEDRFLVDPAAMQHFSEWVNRDLDHYLVNGWNFFNRNEPKRQPTDVIEDVVFFYPIIGCIRNNLIENL